LINILAVRFPYFLATGTCTHELCVEKRFGRSTKSSKLSEIKPMIERIKNYERVVDKMALVEHFNEVNRVQNIERQDKIYQWLSPPDHSSMHNAVFEKRQEKTGVWFMKENHYVEWKTGSKSFLWLYGTGTSSVILLST